MLSISDRFMQHVSPEPNTGCWLWTGCLNSWGYGRLRVHGRTHLAHRFGWELERGPVPSGLELDHLCRNRSCVNPTHLEPVTRSVNQIRGMGFTGVNARKTHCVHGHAFNEGNTRIEVEGGRPRRRCRACHAARERLAQRRKKQRVAGPARHNLTLHKGSTMEVS